MTELKCAQYYYLLKIIISKKSKFSEGVIEENLMNCAKRGELNLLRRIGKPTGKDQT